MMNWIWILPWAIIIIFSAGWYCGGKVSVHKKIQNQMHVREDRENYLYFNQAIAEIYKHLDHLESKIERLYVTKEENKNG